MIVGNHAHVPQPVTLLTNENDETKKTLCLYSTGNAVANIRRNEKGTAHVEDGMLFTVTFAKYSDGTVLVESTRVIPTWVYRYKENGVYQYRVLSMDGTEEDWKNHMNLSDELLALCRESSARTEKVIGAGIAEATQYFTDNQREVEAALGVD